MDKTKIEQFYIRWQAVISERIEGYIYDESRKLLPTRFMFSKFKKIIKKFLTNQLLEIEKIIFRINWDRHYFLLFASSTANMDRY